MDTASDNDKPVTSWLITGTLVLVGVIMGGLFVGAIVPRQDQKATPEVAKSSPPENAAAPAQPASPVAVPAPVPPVTTPAVPATTPVTTYPPATPPATPVTPPAAKQAPAPTEPEATQPETTEPETTAPETTAPETTEPETTEPDPAMNAPAAPAAKKSASAKSATTETAEPAEPAATEADDPAKRAAFVRAAKQTRQAMAKRDLKMAQRHLKSVQGNVQSEADQAELERLQILTDNLEQFWGEVRKAVSKMQPTEELELKDTRVAVIEADRQQLTVRMAGQSRHFLIMELPAPLLQAIVDQSFAPTAGSKVVVGTFLAMDREGDRRQARKLWEAAARAGETLGKQLMPELDTPAAKDNR